MVEIRDQESAKRWAMEKNREALEAFAIRSALRALPMAAHAIEEADIAALLPVLRGALASYVAAGTSQPDVRLAADAAASPAYDAFANIHRDMSTDAARSVAQSVGYAAAISARWSGNQMNREINANAASHAVSQAALALGDVEYVAATADAQYLEDHEGNSLVELPLWPQSQLPEEVELTCRQLSALWGKNPQVWSLWNRWYSGILIGKPLDWDLQREVALIPDADWKQGPEHIARLIEEIEARFVANALAERIELAPSGRLTLVPQPFPEDRHLGLLIDTVQDALDLATSSLRNELPEDTYQVRLLRQTFGRYGNDPQRIEMDFERARVSLIEDIAADAIPASAPNRDLIHALADAAGAIRDSDSEIARNRERLNRIRLGQVSREDAAKIAEVAEQVADISEGVLRDDLLEDRFRLPGVRRDAGVPDPVVPLGAAERNAALEAQAAQIRLYSRLAKAWLFLKAHDQEITLVGSLASVVGLIVAVVAL